MVSSGCGIQIVHFNVGRFGRLPSSLVSELAQQEIDFSADQNGKTGQIKPHIQANGST
jgi:hypothetical protein